MEESPIQRYVIDASVAVKWFVPEDDADSARRLKRVYEEGKADILSPPLVLYEVANALRYHPVSKLSVEDLVTATETLRDMAIIVDMNKETWTQTYEISHAEQITIYDAAYLSLALLNGAMFVTADSRLLNGLSRRLRRNAVLLSAMR